MWRGSGKPSQRRHAQGWVMVNKELLAFSQDGVAEKEAIVGAFPGSA